MGTKNEPGEYDCYANALPDEPMFVLLARDPDFFRLVKKWARRRMKQIQCGERPQSDVALVTEAEQCAWDGQEWRRKNNGVWRKNAKEAQAEAPDDDDNTMRDDPMFNRGVQHVVNLLAKTLEPLGDWYAGDGSEDYDCDLEETLRNILAAKGLYDKETGEFAGAKELQAAVASIPDDLNWLIGKGKTRPDEPTYGAQILRGLKVVAEAENDDLCSAIREAVAFLQPTESP